MALKNLFKKKPGGTLFGNILRAGTKIAGSVFPAAGLVSSLLPEAPPLVTSLANDLVGQALSAPQGSPAESVTWATQAKQTLMAAGATADQASMIGAATHAAASLPPAQAAQALDAAAHQVGQLNSFGKNDVKAILNGAVKGARDGATSAYLDDTALGRDQKRAAINDQGSKFMPWVLGGLAGVFGLLLVMKRK